MTRFRLRGLFLIVLLPLVFLAPNAGAVSTSLVINEVDYDQASIDTAEFLELKNVSGVALSLNGFTVELFNGASTVNATYRTIALPDTTLAAGDYFVICSNPATTANCDLDGGPDTDLIQNGAPDAIGLRNAGTLVDAVSYEGSSAAPYTEGSGVGLLDDPDAGVAGLSRCPDGSDTDQNNLDFKFAASTPGTANTCPAPPNPAGACGDPATLISAIQGVGAASPLLGQQHTIEGVVIGDFDGAGGLNGYFVQEQDADRDADPLTSEGIFVAAVGTSTVGDLVRVRGTVAESGGMTRLGSVTGQVLCSSGNSVTTTNVNLPAPSPTNAPAAFEPLEGMHVKLPQALVISEYFNYDRFGEIVLARPLGTETRHFTPTSVVEPGAPANARFAEYLVNRITLDDGLSINQAQMEFTRHPNGAAFSLTNSFRGGDTVANTVGALSFEFGLWRIQPTGPAAHTSTNPRPGPLESVEGIRVATMNTLNFFLTLDTTASDSGPGPCGGNQNLDCRGADSNQPDEFNRQRAKLLHALSGLDADVIGLNELENTPGVDPIGDPAKGIVAGLNAMPGVGPYAGIDTGPIGTDAIKVGLIYRSNVVRPVGAYRLLTTAVDPRFIDTRSRPVLAQTFEVIATGARFTVAVNHLKSKGSACLPDDPDGLDGQGNCNGTRTLAAQALVDWLATDPTGSDDPDFLIMGDLNAYAKEDPIDAVLAGSDDALGTGDDYTNLVQKFEGQFAYSFVFDGQAGYLDHGLANSAVVDQVLDAAEWHINADEPDLVDYDTSFKSATQDGFFEPNQFRSADHDPLVVTLCADLTACAIDRLREVADELETIMASANKRTRDKIEDVLDKVEQALRRLDRTPPNRQGAAGDIEGATGDLQAAVKQGLIGTLQGKALLDQLARAVRLLAVDAIEEAKAGAGNASKIDEAELELARGDSRLAAGRFKDAVAKYKDAISKAEGA